MRDIIITAKRIKKELILLSSCFAIVFMINIIAIIIYKAPWIEILTQLGYVVIITVILYLLLFLFRFLFSFFRTLFQR